MERSALNPNTQPYIGPLPILVRLIAHFGGCLSKGSMSGPYRRERSIVGLHECLTCFLRLRELVRIFGASGLRMRRLGVVFKGPKTCTEKLKRTTSHLYHNT